MSAGAAARRLAVLRLLRWPGAATAAANAATGFLLAHGPASPGGPGAAAGVCAGAALVYSGGVVLNDFADAERDGRLHPGRPIPSGAVDPRRAAVFAVALFTAGVALSAVLAGPWAGLATALAAASAIAYDLGPRRFALVGAVLLAFARASNGAAGTLAASGFPAALFAPDPVPGLEHLYPLALFAYTLLLTFTSTLEEERPGAAVAGTLAVSLWIVTALAWPLFARTTWPAAPAFPLALHLGTLVAAARTAREPGGPGIGAVVRCGVFGFLLLDATWILGDGRYDAGAGLVIAWVAVRLALMRARS